MTGTEEVLKGATVVDKTVGAGVLVGAMVLEAFSQLKPTL